MKSESGMELVICCLAIASPWFYSFRSFFHSLSNNFPASDNNPSHAKDGIGSFGDCEVLSTCPVNPQASIDQKKQSLKITQLEPDTSSFGMHKKLLPSFIVVDILMDRRSEIRKIAMVWILFNTVSNGWLCNMAGPLWQTTTGTIWWQP